MHFKQEVSAVLYNGRNDAFSPFFCPENFDLLSPQVTTNKLSIDLGKNSKQIIIELFRCNISAPENLSTVRLISDDLAEDQCTDFVLQRSDDFF
mmetsp:Transcript_524/g.1506  ORF Transcript_524/g.1506 Transcript_524/m.1506 type:complete len:94 (-) Transcript_524:1048-1329(-)